MAIVVVKHHPSGGPADASALVDGPTYDNDPHVVTGLENVQNVDTTNASNLTSGTVAAARLPLFTQAGTGAVARTITSKLGEIISVGDYGAVGNGVADDSPAFSRAFTYLTSIGGGTLKVSAGIYYVASGISIPNNVFVIGDGVNSTFIQSWYVDVNTVVLGSSCSLENLTIYGKGTNGDTGTFGATNSALTINGGRSVTRNVCVLGGGYSIYSTSTGLDCRLINTYSGGGYGNADVAIQGALWIEQCSFDVSTTGIAVTNGPIFPVWAATTAYTVGKVVSNGSYLIQCSVSGTSGGSAPTNKNYLVPMTDGTVTWLLFRPALFSGILLATGAGENHIDQTDISGLFSSSITFDCAGGTPVGPNITTVSDSVLSSGVTITSGQSFSLNNCEIAGTVAIAGTYTGAASIIDNVGVGGFSVTVGANAGNLTINDNNLAGGTITVAAGTSNHYRICDNINGTITDGGTGTDKVVETSSLHSFGSNVVIQSPVITLRSPSGTSDIRIGVADTSGATFTVAGTTGGSQVWRTAATTTGSMTWPSGTVDFSATGGTSQVVKQTSSGGMFTVGQLAFSDISGALTNAQLTIAAGTLASLGTALSVTATQPASPASTQIAIPITITGAGSAAQISQVLNITYAAGYTGSSSTFGFISNNLSAGTGNTMVPAAGSNTVVGNTGGSGAAVGTTAGGNIGIRGSAGLGSVNVGVNGTAQLATNSATNIGVMGSAINTGTSPVFVGGWFSLNQTTVPTVSSALIADNGSQALPVALFRVNNATKVQVDSSGNLLGIGATNGIGYGTGAGGTVTQATSKATGVSLSTASGAITMNNAALAAATIVSFVLTDTAIAATDVLVLNHISGGTVGSYTLNAQCAAGSATINIRNNTAGSLSEAVVIQFALIKAVNS